MNDITSKYNAIYDRWVVVYLAWSPTKAALPFPLGGTCHCHCCLGAIGSGMLGYQMQWGGRSLQLPWWVGCLLLLLAGAAVLLAIMIPHKCCYMLPFKAGAAAAAAAGSGGPHSLTFLWQCDLCSIFKAKWKSKGKIWCSQILSFPLCMCGCVCLFSWWKAKMTMAKWLGGEQLVEHQTTMLILINSGAEEESTITSIYHLGSTSRTGLLGLEGPICFRLCILYHRS